MKIERALLINPPSGLYRRDDRCQSKVEDQTVAVIFPPIELAYLAAMLEQKEVICQIQDYPVTCGDWDIFRSNIHLFQPQMLIINTTTPTLVNDLKAAAIAKSIYLDMITIARGEYFSFYDEQVLTDYPQVDILLRGEAELTIAELVTAPDLSSVLGITYRNADGTITRNPARPLLDNLDLIPFPSRHLFDRRTSQQGGRGDRKGTGRSWRERRYCQCR